MAVTPPIPPAKLTKSKDSRNTALTIITDVDGIFTSANISFNMFNKSKHFSVNDSLTATFLQERFPNVEIFALTGDSGEGLELTLDRFRYMDIEVKQCKNVFKYHWIKERYNIANVIYIGDDIFDVAIFKECKYSATVCNAPTELKYLANYVSTHEGGKSGFTDIIFNILAEHLGVNIQEELQQYVIEKEKEYNESKFSKSNS